MINQLRPLPNPVLANVQPPDSEHASTDDTTSNPTSNPTCKVTSESVDDYITCPPYYEEHDVPIRTLYLVSTNANVEGAKSMYEESEDSLNCTPIPCTER